MYAGHAYTWRACLVISFVLLWGSTSGQRGTLNVAPFVNTGCPFHARRRLLVDLEPKEIRGVSMLGMHILVVPAVPAVCCPPVQLWRNTSGQR